MDVCCDFCKQLGMVKQAAVNGKTKMGPWANMCEAHHYRYGVGLGTGRGQQLNTNEPNKQEV